MSRLLLTGCSCVAAEPLPVAGFSQAVVNLSSTSATTTLLVVDVAELCMARDVSLLVIAVAEVSDPLCHIDAGSFVSSIIRAASRSVARRMNSDLVTPVNRAAWLNFVAPSGSNRMETVDAKRGATVRGSDSEAHPWLSQSLLDVAGFSGSLPCL